jgi:hypothetical protein
MSINKNFVVKNGFEVSTDLILANADTNKVGVGTTAPQYTLHVNGGIGATDFYLSGIGTFVDELNVGLGGTVLTVLGIGNSIGIGTALPQYLLDIRSPVSTGQTALYVQGDVRITGDIIADDISIDDITLDEASINYLNVLGIGTLANLYVPSSGIATIGVGIVTNLSGTNLNYSGVGTITTLNSTNGTVTNLTGTAGTITNLRSTSFNNSGIGTITTLNSTNGTITNLTGTAGTITTLNSTNGTITNLTGTAGTITTLNSTNGTVTNLTGTAGTITNLNSTSANLTNISGTNLNYSGIGTINTLIVGTQANKATISYATNTTRTLTIPNVSGDRTFAFIDQDQTFTGTQTFNNLNVTGVSTISNGPVLIGSGTSTGTTSQPLQVSGGAYVSGFVGIGTTNPTSSLHIVGGDSRFGGVIETVSAATTYMSGSAMVLEMDVRQATTYTYTIPTGANIGIVSFRNMPAQTGRASGTTITLLATQNSAGTGNTTAAAGIGTNCTVVGYENGASVAGISTRGLVGSATTVTLSSTGSNRDFVSFFIHYTGGTNTTASSYQVYVTKNGEFRQGTVGV